MEGGEGERSRVRWARQHCAADACARPQRQQQRQQRQQRRSVQSARTLGAMMVLGATPP